MMAPEIEAVKLKHAEHILAVVRGAEKQEAERQKRLRRATSKENLAYLQRRFNAERRKDREHISGLVHDATTVEAALLNGTRGCQRDNRDSGPVRGGVPSTGGTNNSAKSNTNLEASSATEDPTNISLEQVRFMEYVYGHAEQQKAARAHARLMAQLARAEKSADQLHAGRHTKYRNSSNAEASTRNNAFRGTTGRLRGAGAGPYVNSEGNNFSGTAQKVGRRRGEGARGATLLSRVGCGVGGGNSVGRQRLLEEKRDLLQAMKGVVSRQAEALDRMVESSANTKKAWRHRGAGGGGKRERCHSFSGDSGDSFQDRGLRSDGTASNRGSAAGSAPLGLATRSASSPDAPRLITWRPSEDARLSRSAARIKIPPLLRPPRPPENDTSAFLARVGRWSGESRQGPSTRGSVASSSSASYATFCKRDLGGGSAAPRVGRRPSLVPALPI